MEHQIPPRSAVLDTPYDQHGAPDFQELNAKGWQPEDVLDFSVNSNPFGPLAAITHKLSTVDISRYPDRDCLALRNALSHARSPQITPEHIIVTNGTAELITLIANVYLLPTDKVLICAPTFGEYARACKLQGATVSAYFAKRENNFQFDLASISTTLTETTPKLCFICNPNNPTGQVIPTKQLLSLAAEHPQTLFVIDEAYANFATDFQRFEDITQRNIIAMCSMTKDVAIAGIRLGYGVAHPEIIQALSLARAPWSVNSLAQAIGVEAMQQWPHIWIQLQQLQRYKTELAQSIIRLGYSVIPSETNYFLVHVGNAEKCRAALMQRQIQVRDCTSFGLSEFIRIASRLPEENEKLIAALATYKRECLC